MDQKIGIKIEGPVEEKLPAVFMVMLVIALVALIGTVGFLLVEYLHIPVPKFW